MCALPLQKDALHPTDFRDRLSDADLARCEAYTAERGLVTDYGVFWGAYALNLCTEAEVAAAIAADRGIPVYPPEEMARLQVDHQAYDLVTPEDLQHGSILPFAVDSANTTHILLADPSFTFAERVLRSFTGRRVALFVTTRSFVDEQVRKVIARRGGVHVDAERALRELDLSARGRMAQDAKEGARDGAIIAAVDKLIGEAVSLGASDLHLDSTRDGLVVRARIDGHLTEIEKLDPSHTDGDTEAAIGIRQAMFARIFVLCKQPIENAFHQPIDGRFEWEGPTGRRIDIRMACARTAAGDASLAMTLRLLGTSAGDETLNNRGFEPTMLRKVREAAKSTGGFIAVTGPTGSGKSTTLHAIVGELIDPAISIVSIENPVERKVEGLRQFEVRETIDGSSGKMTYASLLRAVLRLDPDVLVAGEIRDAESAEIALQLSNTGHLVLTTLHTNGCLLAIPRLRDFGLSDFTIANECRLLMAQRLVRRLCRHCATETTAPDLQATYDALTGWGYPKQLTWEDVGLTQDDLRESLQLVPTNLRQPPYTNIPHPKTEIARWAGLRHARGCRTCRHSGFVGRLGVYSVVRVTAELRTAILERQPFAQLEALAYEDGSRSLLANAMLRVMRGETSVSEVLREIGAGHNKHSI